MGAQVYGVGELFFTQQQYFLHHSLGRGTQRGASSLGIPTGSGVTLTIQPTQKPLITTQRGNEEM